MILSEEQMQRKLRSYHKYTKKLLDLEKRGIITWCEADMLLSYWQQTRYGTPTKVSAWQRLAILRMCRSNRDLQVTDIPDLEDYIKEE